MMCNVEPVVVNHGMLCWVSCCELCFAILVNHVELFWASGCKSCFVMRCQWLWVMVSYAVPGVWIMVCFAKPSDCESWRALLSKVVVNHDMLYWAQWLRIMVCYSEPVVVNHGLSCWASGFEWRFAMLSQWLWIIVIMLSQWLWIMVYHAEPVVLNHGVLFWTSGCES